MLALWIVMILSFNSKGNEMNEKLENTIKEVVGMAENIPTERKIILENIANYIEKKEDVNLIFVCTHNSRRSQMSEIWAKIAADFYKIGDNLLTYSGGTEATAFNPRAVKALQEQGIKFNKDGDNNPRYTYSSNGKSYTCFSKKYNDDFNPKSNYCAVMTCSEADGNCPYLPGAKERISLTYNDPKEFDGTDLESEKYLERSKQIASEMFYLMSKVKK